MSDRDLYSSGYNTSAAMPAASTGTGRGTPSQASTGSAYASQSSPTDTAKDVVDQVKETTGDVVDQVKDKGSAVVDQVQEQAKSQITQQKDRVAQGVGGVAVALRQTSQNLQQMDQGTAAQYVDQVAEKFEQASGFLQERDLNEIVAEVEDFAAREPVLFLGGAFALGLVAARFLKSTSQRSASRQNRTRALALRPASRGRPLTDYDFDEAAREAPRSFQQSGYPPYTGM